MNIFIKSDEIIKRIEFVSGMTRTEIALQVFDISIQNLSNRIRRNGLDFYQLLTWALNNSVNIDWLLTGQGKEDPDQSLQLELDVELLTDIIESVDIVLKKEKVELTPDKKARFIALQYELCIETGKNPTQNKIERHLKLVA